MRFPELLSAVRYSRIAAESCSRCCTSMGLESADRRERCGYCLASIDSGSAVSSEFDGLDQATGEVPAGEGVDCVTGDDCRQSVALSLFVLQDVTGSQANCVGGRVSVSVAVASFVQSAAVNISGQVRAIASAGFGK